jgi:hypothetical protein
LTVEVRTVFYGETQALLVRSEKAKPHPTTAGRSTTITRDFDHPDLLPTARHGL